MKHMDTQRQALDWLADQGYTENLRLGTDGRIRSESVDWSVEQVVVEQTCRFEGMSNPDDMAVILGVAGPEGRKGAITLPYGPDLSGAQADAVRALNTPETRG